MTIRLRQVLTIFLLLLFCLEHVANASVASVVSKDGVHFGYSQQQGVLLSFDLLAEENEARDNKNEVDVAAPLSDVIIAMDCDTALLTAKKVYGHPGSFLTSGALPRYKFLCSFLI